MTLVLKKVFFQVRIIFFTLFFLFLGCSIGLAQQKAKPVRIATEVYQDADFDSEVIQTVDPEDSLVISKKTYGEFYKVKLKDGTIGYIPDTELDIEGVGTFKARDYVEDIDSENTKLKNEQNRKKQNIKNRKRKNSDRQNSESDLDTESPRLSYKGVTLQLINFHANTLGGEQVADLVAIGFRYQPLPGNYDSAIAYEFLVAPKAPEYYANKTGGRASGALFWTSAQLSNISAVNNRDSIRYGVGPLARLSDFTVTDTVSNPEKKYNLIDLTAGLDVQAGLMLHSRYITLDFGLRYFWDKRAYGGIGLAILF
jgi:hypothetical protein